jgi:hypothetical protein
VVEDASGAKVAGAKLTLREIETNLVATTESGATGLYEFLSVSSGLYEITAEKAGFSLSRTPLIQLDSRQAGRADFTLNVANRIDTVVVPANVPAVNTEDGVLSGTKNFEQLARLPLNFRGAGGSAASAILVFPGVQQDFFGFAWSISGGLPAQVDLSVDGISAIYIPSHIALSIAPSLESVGEMKVSGAGNSAAFGAMGDVTISSTSGTNQSHGGLFWYHQNGALDAKVYNSSVKAPKVFNTFGARTSGPMVLPKLYDGRNRTFFFADFETNLQRSWHLDQLLLPTSDMRNGMLDGVNGPRAVDPFTGAPFPNNRIPETRISNVTRVLLAKYYPLPNYSAGIANNYRGVASDNQDTYIYDIRVDHVIAKGQRIFVRWSSNTAYSLNTSWPPLPPSPEAIYFRSFVGAHTYSPHPNVSNEARYGFTLTVADPRFPFPGKDAVTALGLEGLNLQNAGSAGGFPAFQFEGSSGFASIGKGRDQLTEGRNYQISDTLSWIQRRHTLNFGGEVRRIGYRTGLNKTSGDDFGTFMFSDTFTGNDFADLLLGLPTTSQTAALGPTANLIGNLFDVFVQDAWRISPRFVLNVGVRAEVHPAMSEASGNLTNFDPATATVIIPDESIPTAPGFLSSINACTLTQAIPACTRVINASQAGLPAGLRRTNTDWNPRLGFAWRPGSDKFSVRGGAGIYTATLLGPVGSAMVGVHSSDVRTFDNVSGNRQPLFAFPNVSPSPAALGTIAVAGFRTGVAPDLKDPRSYQWSFTLERELPWRMTALASYVGIQSVGMPEPVDLNQVPASAQPFQAARRPFHNWVQLRSIENLGFANYQGMHLELSRQFHNDFFFQASYQLAKDLGSLGTVGTFGLPAETMRPLTDRFDPRYDRGNLPGVRRNRFLLTALVPLPNAHARSGALGLVDALLGRWEVSTVAMLESGPFQTPAVPAGLDQSNTDILNRSVSARPDRNPGVALVNEVGDQYYNPSAFSFVPAGAGRFGNAGAGILEGPRTISIAAGLAKTFHPAERIRARFEATFRNIANHPNFIAPNTTLGTPQFGRLLSVWPSQSRENSGNRTGQLGIRLDF